MASTAYRHVDSSSGNERIWLVALAGLALIAAVVSITAGPERLNTLLIALIGSSVIAIRPQWGVATILWALMVQYGSRTIERTGWAAAFSSFLPSGEGLFTLNNTIGMLLGVMLAFRIFRTGDWSVVRSRLVQVLAAITVVLIVSSLFGAVDYDERVELGLESLSTSLRALITRFSLVVLFVGFLHRPRDLRMIVGLFVVLALISAWGGSSAVLSGTKEVIHAASYRAGGPSVLIESAGNPNRLALVSTLALVFIWEFSQVGKRRRWGWLLSVVIGFLVFTVFLAASRGGMVGLAVALLLLSVRRHASVARYLYGLGVLIVGAALVSQFLPESNVERLSNLPGIAEDSNAPGSGSAQRRAYTLEIGAKIWTQAPIFGVGLGNWSYKRFLMDPARSTAPAHNSYLNALVEGGVVSFVFYLLLFRITLRQLGAIERTPSVARRAEADGLLWMVSAVRICMLSLMVFAIFADLWELVVFYFLVGTAAALIQRYEPYLPAPARA